MLDRCGCCIGWVNIQDNTKSECVRKKVGVAAPIVENMVESRLSWFSHVRRIPLEAIVRRVDQVEESPIVKGKKRPRKIIGKTIKKDLRSKWPL